MPQVVAKRAVLPIHDRVLRGLRSRGEIEHFESLVDELSAAMTRVPADAVDSEIDGWLSKICQALSLDRSGIYERDMPGGPVRTTHTWVRPKIPPFPKGFDPEKLLKATTDWVMAGNQVVSRRQAIFRPRWRMEGVSPRVTAPRPLPSFRCGQVIE